MNELQIQKKKKRLEKESNSMLIWLCIIICMFNNFDMKFLFTDSRVNLLTQFNQAYQAYQMKINKTFFV